MSLLLRKKYTKKRQITLDLQVASQWNNQINSKLLKEKTCRTDVVYVLVETKVRRDCDTDKTDVLAGSDSISPKP